MSSRTRRSSVGARGLDQILRDERSEPDEDGSSSQPPTVDATGPGAASDAFRQPGMEVTDASGGVAMEGEAFSLPVDPSVGHGDGAGSKAGAVKRGGNAGPSSLLPASRGEHRPPGVIAPQDGGNFMSTVIDTGVPAMVNARGPAPVPASTQAGGQPPVGSADEDDLGVPATGDARAKRQRRRPSRFGELMMRDDSVDDEAEGGDGDGNGDGHDESEGEAASAEQPDRRAADDDEWVPEDRKREFIPRPPLAQARKVGRPRRMKAVTPDILLPRPPPAPDTDLFREAGVAVPESLSVPAGYDLITVPNVRRRRGNACRTLMPKKKLQPMTRAPLESGVRPSYKVVRAAQVVQKYVREPSGGGGRGRDDNEGNQAAAPGSAAQASDGPAAFGPGATASSTSSPSVTGSAVAGKRPAATGTGTKPSKRGRRGPAKPGAPKFVASLTLDASMANAARLKRFANHTEARAKSAAEQANQISARLAKLRKQLDAEPAELARLAAEAESAALAAVTAASQFEEAKLAASNAAKSLEGRGELKDAPDIVGLLSEFEGEGGAAADGSSRLAATRPGLYSTFRGLWYKYHFDGTTTEDPVLQRAYYREAWSYFGRNTPLLRQVAVIYVLYTLYMAQLTQPRMKISVTLEQMEHLRAMHADICREGLADAYHVHLALHEREMFSIKVEGSVGTLRHTEVGLSDGAAAAAAADAIEAEAQADARADEAARQQATAQRRERERLLQGVHAQAAAAMGGAAPPGASAIPALPSSRVEPVTPVGRSWATALELDRVSALEDGYTRAKSAHIRGTVSALSVVTHITDKIRAAIVRHERQL